MIIQTMNIECPEINCSLGDPLPMQRGRIPAEFQCFPGRFGFVSNEAAEDSGEYTKTEKRASFSRPYQAASLLFPVLDYPGNGVQVSGLACLLGAGEPLTSSLTNCAVKGVSSHQKKQDACWGN